MRNLTGDRPATKVDITIPRAALEAIFDECDRYDRDETGGRLIGTYRTRFGGRLSISVSGVIEPGPSARRSSTSFFQDGEYQETIFRRVEEQHRDIEHLGNWHTHHVNGYPTLSGGDRETYHRIVNHQNHNTDFFYALLVTARNGAGRGDRYSVRHFIVRRGDLTDYEIPSEKIHVVNRPILWPDRAMVDHPTPNTAVSMSAPAPAAVTDQRPIDSDFFKQLYPGLRPFLSKSTGGVYWRGRIPLVDRSEVEILIAEVDSGHAPYGAAVKSEPSASTTAANAVGERRFRSAREAVVVLERELNCDLYRSRVGG